MLRWFRPVNCCPELAGTQKRSAERTSSVQWLFGVYSLFGTIFGICVNLFYIHFQYYYNNMYLIQRYLLDFDLVHCALSTFTHLFARLVVGCGLKRADAAGKRKLSSQSCMFFWVSWWCVLKAKRALVQEWGNQLNIYIYIRFVCEQHASLFGDVLQRICLRIVVWERTNWIRRGCFQFAFQLGEA